MNKLTIILTVAIVSLLASACGQAIQTSAKTPVFAESIHDADYVAAEQKKTEVRAREMRKIDEYSKSSASDVFVITSADRGHTQMRPEPLAFGDLTKACDTLYQIIGYEEITPLFGSRNGAGEYALLHPELFPPQGADADGNPMVTIITRPICREKHTLGELTAQN